MADFLDMLARDAQVTVDSGYYQTLSVKRKPQVSLRTSIIMSKNNSVITEIKAASPSAGVIRNGINPKEIAQAMERGGAAGISVLTEPKHFKGSLNTLMQAREAVKLPILMKDVVISQKQVEAAVQIGANAILLIEALFERGYAKMAIDEMITFAHSRGLEVLLETHTEQEFALALKTDADLVGINNRNLATFKIDLNTTKKILEKHKNPGKTIISESGITTPEDLQFLRGCGASGFLIGSAIMLTENVEEKVKEFVYA